MTNHRKLLVIDDEPDICRVLECIARNEGWDVLSVTHSPSAGAAVRAFRPDGIILDIMMPDMDGIEVLRQLADDGCTADILLLSGGHNLYANLAQELGRQSGLSNVTTARKPIDLDSVLAFLAGVRHAADLVAS